MLNRNYLWTSSPRNTTAKIWGWTELHTGLRNELRTGLRNELREVRGL